MIRFYLIYKKFTIPWYLFVTGIACLMLITFEIKYWMLFGVHVLQSVDISSTCGSAAERETKHGFLAVLYLTPS